MQQIKTNEGTDANKVSNETPEQPKEKELKPSHSFGLLANEFRSYNVYLGDGETTHRENSRLHTRQSNSGMHINDTVSDRSKTKLS